mmetsp:Transcript_45093/g.94001  ORF Transcript_45093/g.94001 Transcript_45093/m.94001 type:complete len:240 (+) Transcript_45093:569-1288(+)
MSEKSSGLARSLRKPCVEKSISVIHSCPPGRNTRNASATMSLVACGGSSWITRAREATSKLSQGRPVSAASARMNETRPSHSSGLTHEPRDPHSCASCAPSSSRRSALASACIAADSSPSACSSPFPCAREPSSSSLRPTARKCGDRSTPTTAAARGKRRARRRVETPEPQPRSRMRPPSAQHAPNESSALSNAERKASSPSLPCSGKLRAPTALLAISTSQAASQHKFPFSYEWKGAL